MKRTITLPLCALLLASSPAFGQSAGDFGDERAWVAEHPEALQALGAMPREELGQFLQTYQGLSAEEKAKVREHAADLQQLGPSERKWALQNPDAVRQLGTMSDDDRKKFLETYKNLTPEEQEKLRGSADQLGKLSAEERTWALENPDAVKQLGNLPDADRDKMMDAYQNLSPDAQRMIRKQMGR